MEIFCVHFFLRFATQAHKAHRSPLTTHRRCSTLTSTLSLTSPQVLNLNLNLNLVLDLTDN